MCSWATMHPWMTFILALAVLGRPRLSFNVKAPKR